MCVSTKSGASKLEVFSSHARSHGGNVRMVTKWGNPKVVKSFS